MVSIFKRKKFWIWTSVAAVAVIVIVLLAVLLTRNNDDDNNDNEETTITAETTTFMPTLENTTPLPQTPTEPPEDFNTFPADFKFGSASAAYQIEGAWDRHGKGESIWDHLTHNSPHLISDGSNGDVAANSYELYKEDVKALKQVGVDFYRFSISWPRVLPTGDISSINEEGLQYYDNLINELIANGIEPMVTMYHWDLPQKLQDLGGWTNRYIIAYFEQYAKLLFERYGDRVKVWNTFNEPSIFCLFGYTGLNHAPAINSAGTGEYLCAHHVLLSNARVYHMYKNNYYQQQQGKVGIVLQSDMSWPLNPNSAADVNAADRSLQYWLGWYAHPIFSENGNYPQMMINDIYANSFNEGRRKSRLPEFTPAEIQEIKGSSDFMGLNYYTSNYATPLNAVSPSEKPSFFLDRNVHTQVDTTWPQAESPWLYSSPQGIHDLLVWIKDQYNNPEVIITENGWSDTGDLDDIGRINYLKDHLKAILDANRLSGCHVTGYTYWSILDNFQWLDGYTQRFGMYYIDFTTNQLARVAKRSAYVYNEIITTKKIPIVNVELPPQPEMIFENDFMFGASSASYQIEGAWDRDGKGESIWDHLTHTQPEVISDNSNGDVAANSYDFYKEDVRALTLMGVNFYRFSISWPRVLPTGDISSRNEDGLLYYDRLIDELLANDIEPMVTMYHWDLPQKLQDLGGWSNRYIINYFEQYAKLLFERYGRKVKYWNTFNEAALFCTSGFSAGHAPRLWSPGVGEYLCSHHVLLSHARVYHLYHAGNYNWQGKIGIALNSGHAWPRNPIDQDDIEAAERYNQFQLGMYAHPIYSKAGGYPEVVLNTVRANSAREGRRKSRLPEFTQEEIDSLRGSADFFGLNYYTSAYAQPGSWDWMPNPSFVRDVNITEHHPDSWPVAKSTWLRSVPVGLRDLLKWIKTEYDNPEVIITENGWSDDGELEDLGRIEYMNSHLAAILEAKVIDGCNVKGYTHWSIIDNFEWTLGFSERFGLFHIDFESEAKTRTPKRSVYTYKYIIENRKIPVVIPALQRFPDYFLFGSASASYQIEGAWDKDGKGENIWDRLTQSQPHVIADRSNGNVAANSYEFFKDDVQALKLSGANFYRFSISWTRILPTGDISSKNEFGLQYYDNLINELLANGIEPMITMYHWDLPQTLQDLGGWTNRYIINYFEQYAMVVFERYADRVKFWNTFNEPALFCTLGYTGAHAPRLWSPAVGEYLCAHHVLLAHARTYHYYRNTYFNQYGGKVGIALNTGHNFPKDPSNPEHVAAADRAYQFYLGWFAHAIFTEQGNYPQVMIDRVGANSAGENRRKSRLPVFTAEEIEYIKGTSDFLGLNYYSSSFTEPAQDVSWAPLPSRDRDQLTQGSIDFNWPVAESTWLFSIPEGLRALLNHVKNEYNNVETIITENGWSDRGEMNDIGRIKYMTEHIQAVLDANVVDGCNVTAYTYWSVIDNFEWLQGYTERFGMFHVDFYSEEKLRTPKRSVSIFRDIIETRRIPHDWNR